MIDIEIVRNLSSKQRKNLIRKLRSSELFEISPCKIGFIPLGFRVNVKNIKEGHPKYFFGYLPVGFIGRNYAELVNLDEKFPEDYHSKLRESYNSI